MHDLTQLEKVLHEFLAQRLDPVPFPDLLEDLARALGAPPAVVEPTLTTVLAHCEAKGLVVVASRERRVVELVAPEAIHAGLPERRVLVRIGTRLGDRLEGPDLARLLGSSDVCAEGVRRGIERGWFELGPPGEAGGGPEDRGLRLLERGVRALGRPEPDEALLERLAGVRTIHVDELEALGFNRGDSTIRTLLRREGIVRLLPRMVRSIRAADRPRGAALSAPAGPLASGSIDVTERAPEVLPVKSHPLTRLIEDTRQAFLELGFEEMSSPMIESAFWVFDALFQPQDHPAREMQETFYCAEPSTARLPSAAIVEQVRRTHEDGGDTGSTGWRYAWDPARARQVVLRTHTTAATIRALSTNPDPPRKVFVVGRVFRNERMGPTKLPEFHQVDGIVVDRRANFATLLGLLKIFYAKMGFERIRFRPAFFPYTEPSTAIFVYFERLDRWVKMGGGGLFRPEVTIPQGCRMPVLAWGLGLEQLALFRYGIDDLRLLYQTDLDWLRRVPLCR